MSKIDTVIFDLGAVLIDWSPRYLYRKIFKTEDEITWFLENVCTSDWNEEQDAGRTFADARAELLIKHPDLEVPIRAWHDRWPEMLSGPIQGTVDIFQQLKDSKKYRFYALTNWSAESFPWALERFNFLQWFDGIVVSGHEKIRKPYPEFYQILLNRYTVEPANALFIDDNSRNIEAAKKLGITSIHFQSPEQLKQDLERLKVF